MIKLFFIVLVIYLILFSYERIQKHKKRKYILDFLNMERKFSNEMLSSILIAIYAAELEVPDKVLKLCLHLSAYYVMLLKEVHEEDVLREAFISQITNDLRFSREDVVFLDVLVTKVYEDMVK